MLLIIGGVVVCCVWGLILIVKALNSVEDFY